MSTPRIHICWGAQAGLYYHYGIPKILIWAKSSSASYPHYGGPANTQSPLFRGI